MVSLKLAQSLLNVALKVTMSRTTVVPGVGRGQAEVKAALKGAMVVA